MIAHVNYQRLKTRLVGELRHVPYEEWLPQLNLFSLERSRLLADPILAFKICQGEVNQSPPDVFLPKTPSWVKRAHLQITAKTKPSSTKNQCAFVHVMKYRNKLSVPLVKHL